MGGWKFLLSKHSLHTSYLKKVYKLVVLKVVYKEKKSWQVAQYISYLVLRSIGFFLYANFVVKEIPCLTFSGVLQKIEV